MATYYHKRYNAYMSTRIRTSPVAAAAPAGSVFIGVDIGGSKMLVASSTDGVTIKNQAKTATPDNSKDGITQIIRLIDEVAGDQKVAAIAVAAPGPLDLIHGHILKTPNMTWEETAICELLKARYDAPCILENDANAGALAEALIGAAASQPFVLYVTVSTGVGTGLVINGKVYHGAHDTEGGHMLIPTHDRTLKGSEDGAQLETEISGRALKRRFNQLGFQIPADSKNWDIFAHDLALGLHNLSLVLSPSVIVLGGGVSVHFDKFRDHLSRHLSAYHGLYPHPPIVQAQMVEEAPIHGALLLATRLA